MLFASHLDTKFESKNNTFLEVEVVSARPNPVPKIVCYITEMYLEYEEFLKISC